MTKLFGGCYIAKEAKPGMPQSWGLTSRWTEAGVGRSDKLSQGKQPFLWLGLKPSL
jgi:hypothetical protein